MTCKQLIALLQQSDPHAVVLIDYHNKLYHVGKKRSGWIAKLRNCFIGNVFKSLFKCKADVHDHVENKFITFQEVAVLSIKKQGD